jgi:hypothetical protein
MVRVVNPPVQQNLRDYGHRNVIIVGPRVPVNIHRDGNIRVKLADDVK